MPHSHLWFDDRLVDDAVVDDLELSLIYGYQSQVLVSLETALLLAYSLTYQLFENRERTLLSS
jgi:hypothetical protein